jgi:hypothetical protein
MITAATSSNPARIESKLVAASFMIELLPAERGTAEGAESIEIEGMVCSGVGVFLSMGVEVSKMSWAMPGEVAVKSVSKVMGSRNGEVMGRRDGEV